MADWTKIGRGGNIEDRRGTRTIAGGLSIGSFLVIMALQYFTGIDIFGLLYQFNALPTSTQQQQVSSEFEGSDSYEQFASAVLGSNNAVWEETLRTQDAQYREPRLVLFRDATQSGCGIAQSAVGPHYCPLDETMYLDETFFEELTRRLGAQGGDVAEAYVIAHEVGHHVQNQLGTLQRVQNAAPQGSQEANQLSIQLELQADCYAGIWAHALRGEGIFEPGEIREAMDAAESVGDDRIQERVTGQVSPETWTHGSSEQRVTWFTRGYETGDFEECNTF